jgi:hypothetical protein
MFKKWKNRDRWSVIRSAGKRFKTRLFMIDRRPSGELIAIPERCTVTVADLFDVATFMRDFMHDAQEARRRLEAHFAEDRTEIWDG